MAKTDLLKEAIADAKIVKETALANAKIALQEAFAPRIESMLSARLAEELDDEEMNDDEFAANGEENLDGEMGDEFGNEEGEELGDIPDSVAVGLDFNHDGEYDLTGDLGAEEEEEFGDEAGAAVNPEDEYTEDGEETDDLELESIIRELEGLDNETAEESYANEEDEMNEDIDAIIEAILREEDETVEDEEETDEVNEMKAELEEAYNTIRQMQSVIQEVNLLNAKLLYTNKLFRNYELSENQKMKVLENFDRANNTREVKLVFSTLAEAFNKPTAKKKMVKESFASKPVASTKPNVEKTILSEGFAQAERWKKLAGLL